MAQQNQLPANPTAQTDVTQPSTWTIQQIVTVTAAALGGVIVVVFVIGLLLALFSDVETTAFRIQIIRDILIVLIALESILIIGALAVLILHIARLVNLVQTETKPVLENTQDVVNNAKGTVDFVGKNVAQPVVKVGAFMAGAGVFMRDVGGIRRAIRPSRKAKQIESDE